MKRTWMMVLLVNLMLSACAPVTGPTSAPSATPLSVAVLAPTSTATPTATVTVTPSPTPTDTATPSPTPSPTATATPTPIPTLLPEQVGGLSGVPDPRVTNPELFDLTRRDGPIPQFVNAMKKAGIEVSPDKVLNDLQFISTKADGAPLLDKDGKPFIVAAYNLDPNPNQTGETLEGPIPLLIATQNENEEWGWRRALFSDAIKIYRASNINNVRTVIAVTSDEFFYWKNNNKFISENFTAFTIPYDYSGDTKQRYDRDVNFRIIALKDLKTNNPVLIIGLTDLEDLKPEDFSSLEDVMTEVRKRISHGYSLFKQINNGDNIYVVLNEIHQGTPIYSFWEKFGDQFIIETFRIAQEVIKKNSPNAQLIYNETYNYAQEFTFYPDTLRIVKLLRKQELIDGVGMQMHMYLNDNETDPRLEEMKEIMQSFGIPVYITEFDISQIHLGNNPNYTQAVIAYKVVKSCVSSGTCVDLGFFGSQDNFSWLGPKAKAHPFDSNGQPKLFYYAILKALFNL